MNGPKINVTPTSNLSTVKWTCDVCRREFPKISSCDGPMHLLKCKHDDTFSIADEASDRQRAREAANKEGRAAGRKEVFESLAKVLVAEAPDVLKDAYLDSLAEEYSHESELPPSPPTQPEDIAALALS